eukprot:3748628-Rhodomonas_salina.2
MATAEEDCILETPRKRKIAPKEPRNPRPASFATRRESRGNGFSWTTQQPMAPPIRQAKLLHKKLSLKPMAGSVRDSACTRTFIGSMLRDASAARWYAEMFRKGGMQNIANVFVRQHEREPRWVGAVGGADQLSIDDYLFDLERGWPTARGGHEMLFAQGWGDVHHCLHNVCTSVAEGRPAALSGLVSHGTRYQYRVRSSRPLGQ